MFPGGSAVNCNAGPFAALQARFTFTNAGCGAANVLRISQFAVNGPSTTTSGIDLRLQYNWPQFVGGSLTAGLDATYLLDYKRGAFTLNGAPNIVFAPPEDRAGLHDLVVAFFSYPQLKGNIFAGYSHGDLTVRLQTRYTEGTSPAAGTPATRWVVDASGNYVQQPVGKTADFWQHDFIVRLVLPWNTDLTASVQNIANTDPPDAPSQYNYDYTKGNPLGRVYELDFKKRF